MRRFLLELCGLFLISLSPLNAGLIVQNFTPDASGSIGDTLSFTGDLVNDGTDVLFLNGLNIIVNGPDTDLLADNSIFFSEAPLFLLPHETAGSIGLFTVSILPSFSGQTNQYFGSFSVIGGLDEVAQESLANAQFSVTVTPEPNPLHVLVIASCLGAIWRRQRHRAKFSKGSISH